jgi:hypothetical protein
MVNYSSSQHQPHIQPVDSPLHVVVGLSNPLRYASRYSLYTAFRKYVADSSAVLTTVELALGDRAFEVTDPTNPNDVQLRSDSVLWHKENLIDIGMRHIFTKTYPDAEYVGWIDSDVTFSRADWAAEAVHLLQTYDVIQMWSHSIDLGPKHQPIAYGTSFVWNWQQNESILQPWDRAAKRQKEKPWFTLPRAGDDRMNWTDGSHITPPPGPDPQPPMLHTGYAWAARREILEALGLLGDIGILGSGDRHMAYALIGEVDKSYPGGIDATYQSYWNGWQTRAEANVKRNIGAMENTVTHAWHGSKVNRRYQDRWKILVGDQFDWTRDLIRDMNGVWKWTRANPKLERDVRQYFAVRNEDSVDL